MLQLLFCQLSVVINDNIKSLANIKERFKRRISWNKHRFEITTQTKNYNLDYLIYSIFRNINRSFVLSFKNGNDDATENYFDKYYMSSVEIKDFNVLTNNKPFSDPPVKNKQEAYENLLKCEEIMTIQQEIHEIICIIKNIKNLLV